MLVVRDDAGNVLSARPVADCATLEEARRAAQGEINFWRKQPGVEIYLDPMATPLSRLSRKTVVNRTRVRGGCLVASATGFHNNQPVVREWLYIVRL